MEIYLHDKDMPKSCYGCIFSKNIWGPNKFEVSADCTLLNQRVSCTKGVDIKCPLRRVEEMAKEKELKETIEKILKEIMHIPVIEGKFVKVDDLVNKLKEIATREGVEIEGVNCGY